MQVGKNGQTVSQSVELLDYNRATQSPASDRREFSMFQRASRRARALWAIESRRMLPRLSGAMRRIWCNERWPLVIQNFAKQYPKPNAGVEARHRELVRGAAR
jgi:hypothetical protein